MPCDNENCLLIEAAVKQSYRKGDDDRWHKK
ncbi:ChaB family protein [Serratia liquefaciens]|nr:ChaB family protein [Serratia liquefaciens]